MMAASQGQEDVVRLLLDLGADINQVDGSLHSPKGTPKRQTALHKAAAALKANCVEVLLKAGADKTMKDSRGATPYDSAYVSKFAFPDLAGPVLALLQ